MNFGNFASEEPISMALLSEGTSSTPTANFAWNTNTSALLSDGSFNYIYGLNTNVPIAQINVSAAVTDELLGDTNANVRGPLCQPPVRRI